MSFCFFFQAEDGIRDLVRSRGLGDVYKRQGLRLQLELPSSVSAKEVAEYGERVFHNALIEVISLSLIHI